MILKIFLTLKKMTILVFAGNISLLTNNLKCNSLPLNNNETSWIIDKWYRIKPYK